jgi:class 3 adenylate cyclase
VSLVHTVTALRTKTSASTPQCARILVVVLCYVVSYRNRSGTFVTLSRARAGMPVSATTEHREVALLTTDIVGFTALSVAIGAEELVELLDT